MARVETTCLECCGVSMAQCHILVEVGRARQLTLSSLAAVLRLDLSSASRGVEALVQGGFLCRERHPADRRYVIISLTAKGQEAFNRAETSGLDLAARIIGQLPLARREAVSDCMDILSAAIEECCPSEPYPHDKEAQ